MILVGLVELVNQQRSKFLLLDFPQILSAVTDKSNITVNWTAPFDGDCPVTSYTVYYRVVERMYTNVWKEVTLSSYQLQITLQLKCQKMYEIEVTAWSSYGETTREQSQVVPTWGGNYFPKMLKKVHSMLLFIAVNTLSNT